MRLFLIASFPEEEPEVLVCCDCSNMNRMLSASHNQTFDHIATMDFVFRERRASFSTMLWIYWTLFHILVISSAQAQECEGDSNTCSSSNGSLMCHFDASICTVPSSVYGSGGSAVAYVPNLPAHSAVVCNATRLSSVPYKVARWPWRRSTMKKKAQPHHASVAPTLEIKINLLACQFSSEQGSKVNPCCCQKLSHANDILVDIWHARPDGTYPSIAAAMHSPDARECRTRVTVPPFSQSVVVTTVAPGSTGSLYGLGPSGWEFLPYGPPVIHVLVQSSDDDDTSHSIVPTLVDIPVVIQSGTWQPGRFYGSDVRGGAWMKPSRKNPQYNITSWIAQPPENHIALEVDLYVPQPSVSGKRNRASSLFRTMATTASKRLPFSQSKADSRRRSSVEDASVLCPSYIYGGPNSFFLEPIAVCAPSLLDYFDL
jgi:hypothetical protein